MRSTLLLSACVAVLGLAACSGGDEGGADGQVTPEEADAAAGGSTVAADSAEPVGGPDVRGTTGTTPPDGSGKPGTTSPTVPPESPEASNQSTPGSASN